MVIGKKLWAIPEGYIPSKSNVPRPEMESHDTVSILNTSDSLVGVTISIYFSDREPAGPYKVEVAPRRTMHLRLNSLEDPEPVPRDTDFATVIEAELPVVVQYTRLDSRQSENALLSTMAYGSE